MMKRARTGFAGLLAIAALGLTAGCSKTNSPPKLEDSAFIGTWTEMPDTSAANNPRTIRVPRKSQNMRQITFNADHSFKALLVKGDGQPEEANKTLEGNWQLEADGNMAFKINKSTVAKKMEEWISPAALGGLEKTSGETRCFVTHQDGSSATYKKGG